MLDATVLIATYNRADLLDETLAHLARARVSPRLRWDVIVVDNNSTDNTRQVVERHMAGFPVRLGYLFEARQGRSSALNTGIRAAQGAVLVFTDDDVRVVDDWLDAATAPLLSRDDAIAYTGGPVRPIWGAPAPKWLDLERGDLWGTIAIQNYGSDPFIFEERRKVPLGANMAVRKDTFDAIGGFRADLGRSDGRLILGQEVPELLMRARDAGLRGKYVPEMQVYHHVPAKRLTQSYFRRWWFGKGVSRAALERMQRVTELGVDLHRTPHVLGVPRYMYRSALHNAIGAAVERVLRRPEHSFRHQMMVMYFAGYAWARWRRAGMMPAQRPDPNGQRTSNVVSTGR